MFSYLIISPIKPYSWFKRCFILWIKSHIQHSWEILSEVKYILSIRTYSLFQTEMMRVYSLCCAYACFYCTYSVRALVYATKSNILRLCLQVPTKSHHFQLNTCRSVRSALQRLDVPGHMTGPPANHHHPHAPPFCVWSSPPSTSIGVEVNWWMGNDSMWPSAQLFNV